MDKDQLISECIEWSVGVIIPLSGIFASTIANARYSTTHNSRLLPGTIA